MEICYKIIKGDIIKIEKKRQERFSENFQKKIIFLNLYASNYIAPQKANTDSTKIRDKSRIIVGDCNIPLWLVDKINRKISKAIDI